MAEECIYKEEKNLDYLLLEDEFGEDVVDRAHRIYTKEFNGTGLPSRDWILDNMSIIQHSDPRTEKVGNDFWSQQDVDFESTFDEKGDVLNVKINKLIAEQKRAIVTERGKSLEYKKTPAGQAAAQKMLHAVYDKIKWAGGTKHKGEGMRGAFLNEHYADSEEDANIPIPTLGKDEGIWLHLAAERITKAVIAGEKKQAAVDRIVKEMLSNGDIPRPFEKGQDGKNQVLSKIDFTDEQKNQDNFKQSVLSFLNQYRPMMSEMEIQHKTVRKGTKYSKIDGVAQDKDTGAIIIYDIKTKSKQSPEAESNFNKIKEQTWKKATEYQSIVEQLLTYKEIINAVARELGWVGDLVDDVAMWAWDVTGTATKKFNMSVKKQTDAPGSGSLTSIADAHLRGGVNLIRPENVEEMTPPRGSKQSIEEYNRSLSGASLYLITPSVADQSKITDELGTRDMGVGTDEPGDPVTVERTMGKIRKQAVNIANAMKGSTAIAVNKHLSDWNIETDVVQVFSGVAKLVSNVEALLRNPDYISEKQLAIASGGLDNLKGLLEKYKPAYILNYLEKCTGLNASDNGDLVALAANLGHFVLEVTAKTDQLMGIMDDAREKYAIRTWGPYFKGKYIERVWIPQAREDAMLQAQKDIRDEQGRSRLPRRDNKLVIARAEEIYQGYMTDPVSIRKRDKEAAIKFKQILGISGARTPLVNGLLSTIQWWFENYARLPANIQAFMGWNKKDGTKGPAEWIFTTLEHMLERELEIAEEYNSQLKPLVDDIRKNHNNDYNFMIAYREDKKHGSVPYMPEEYDWHRFYQDQSTARQLAIKKYPIKGEFAKENAELQRQEIEKWNEENTQLNPKYKDTKDANEDLKKAIIDKIESMVLRGHFENEKIVKVIVKQLEGSKDIIQDFKDRSLTFCRGVPTIVMDKVNKPMERDTESRNAILIAETPDGQLAERIFWQATKMIYTPKKDIYGDENYKIIEQMDENDGRKKFYNFIIKQRDRYDLIADKSKQMLQDLPAVFEGDNQGVDILATVFRRSIKEAGGYVIDKKMLKADAWKKKWGWAEDIIKAWRDNDNHDFMAMPFSGYRSTDMNLRTKDLGYAWSKVLGSLAHIEACRPYVAAMHMIIDMCGQSMEGESETRSGTRPDEPNPMLPLMKELVLREVYKKKTPEPGLAKFLKAYLKFKTLTVLAWSPKIAIKSHVMTVASQWAYHGGEYGEMSHWSRVRANLDFIANDLKKVFSVGFANDKASALVDWYGLKREHDLLASSIDQTFLQKVTGRLAHYAGVYDGWHDWYVPWNSNFIVYRPLKAVGKIWQDIRELGFVYLNIQDYIIKRVSAFSHARSVPCWDKERNFLGTLYDNMSQDKKTGKIIINPKVYYTNIDNLNIETGVGGYRFDPVNVKRDLAVVTSKTLSRTNPLDRPAASLNLLAKAKTLFQQIGINVGFEMFDDYRMKATGRERMSAISALFYHGNVFKNIATCFENIIPLFRIIDFVTRNGTHLSNPFDLPKPQMNALNNIASMAFAAITVHYIRMMFANAKITLGLSKENTKIHYYPRAELAAELAYTRGDVEDFIAPGARHRTRESAKRALAQKAPFMRDAYGIILLDALEETLLPSASSVILNYFRGDKELPYVAEMKEIGRIKHYFEQKHRHHESYEYGSWKSFKQTLKAVNGELEPKFNENDRDNELVDALWNLFAPAESGTLDPGKSIKRFIREEKGQEQ